MADENNNPELKEFESRSLTIAFNRAVKLLRSAGIISMDLPETKTVVLALSDALIDICASLKDARKEWISQHPEDEYVMLDMNEPHVLASAFWAAMENCAEDVHPYSILGDAFVIFAKAILRLDAFERLASDWSDMDGALLISDDGARLLKLAGQ